MTLMDTLVCNGYNPEEFFHHCSDLYIFATPKTIQVVNNWFKESGYNPEIFVEYFIDNVTGREMMDIAFQYTPYFKV